MNAPQPGTPLPWKVIPTPLAEIRIGYNVKGNWLASVWSDETDEALIAEAKADAAYIVHACNNFPKAQTLADALRDAIHEVAAVERCVSNAATGREMRDQIGKWAIALAAWDAKP
jgi:hypothetical protein